MIELFLIARFFADYFWEIKTISAFVALFLPVLFFLYFSFTNRLFLISLPDFLFSVFLVAICFSEFLSDGAGSNVELAKFLAFFFSYLAGRIINFEFKCSQIFSYLCFLSLLLFFISSIFGYGYQDWGAVRTFVGGYYFKTDMAMAAIIWLVFISVLSRSRFLIFFGITICGYLVFITNARIALPLVALVPILAISLRNGWIRDFDGKAIIYILLGGLVGSVGLVLLDFVGENMLGFDFSEPFSEANTQGRTAIWATILTFYFEAPLVKQIIGLGLGADVYATSLLDGSHLAGLRAHNSFIYLLVCTGLIGLISISWFFFSVGRRLPLLLQSANLNFVRVGSLALIFLIVTLCFSLTTEVIIRPQLMIIVFLFCGISVQAYSLEKRVASE